MAAKGTGNVGQGNVISPGGVTLKESQESKPGISRHLSGEGRLSEFTNINSNSGRRQLGTQKIRDHFQVGMKGGGLRGKIKQPRSKDHL